MSYGYKVYFKATQPQPFRVDGSISWFPRSAEAEGERQAGNCLEGDCSVLVGRSVGRCGAMLIDFLINKVCKLLAPHNSRGMI